eukprot:353435-Chlamydomonas_euryale.AAC.16
MVRDRARARWMPGRRTWHSAYFHPGVTQAVACHTSGPRHTPKVAMERQSLQLLISRTLHELEVFSKAQPLIESVMAMEAAEVQMQRTIEHERATTATVKQLRNDLKVARYGDQEGASEGGCG